MNARGSLLRVAGLAALALGGGLVALGGVALTGGLGDGTTTVVESSPAPAAAAPAAADGRLSISDIYDRAAPGVVQITSTSRPTGESLGSPLTPSGAQQALGEPHVLQRQVLAQECDLVLQRHVLAVGVVGWSPEFRAGDGVELVGEDGVPFARGIASVDAPELAGRPANVEAVHRDRLVLL